jgi:hypothetical protein
VTDLNTGLQWEKKDNLRGGANFSDPHDADNGYTWSAEFNGTARPSSVPIDPHTWEAIAKAHQAELMARVAIEERQIARRVAAVASTEG